MLTPPPLINYKAIGLLINTGLNPMENHKLPSQHLMVGHHWPARETSNNLCFVLDLLMQTYIEYLLEQKEPA